MWKKTLHIQTNCHLKDLFLDLIRPREQKKKPPSFFSHRIRLLCDDIYSMRTLQFSCSTYPYWISSNARYTLPVKFLGSWVVDNSFELPGAFPLQCSVAASSYGISSHCPDGKSKLLIGWITTAVPVPNISTNRPEASASITWKQV